MGKMETFFLFFFEIILSNISPECHICSFSKDFINTLISVCNSGVATICDLKWLTDYPRIQTGNKPNSLYRHPKHISQVLAINNYTLLKDMR